jgi:septin family protein
MNEQQSSQEFHKKIEDYIRKKEAEQLASLERLMKDHKKMNRDLEKIVSKLKDKQALSLKG